MLKFTTRYWLFLALLISIKVFSQDQPIPLSLTDAERAWLIDHPVITFAADPFFSPIEFYNEEGQFSGITQDYLTYIAKQINVTFKPVKTDSWAESVDLTRSGKVFMLSSELKTPENTKYYEFSKPHIIFPTVILARENVIRQQKYEDLSGKRLAVVQGYPDIDLIRESYPDIELLEVPTVVDALRMTAFGQADAMSISQPVASYYIEKEGITNLHVVGVADYVSHASFAVNKEHAVLAHILSKVLDAMPKQEMQKIFNRWVLLKTNLNFDYGPLIKISIVAGLIILLLITWIYQTQTQKRRLQREISMRQSKENELNHVMEELQKVNHQLEVAIITDPLTGVMNRRGFYELLNTELSRVMRYGGEAALLMMDIDHFKVINDTHGHRAGDSALHEFTLVCKNVVRSIDVISRIGGEEFAVLLPNTNIESAVILAERIREAVEGISIELVRGMKIRMTVSIGIASYEKNDDADTFIQKADQALYFAKNNGRNQVVCYHDLQNQHQDHSN